jgi:hypothetical protein
MTDDPLNGPTNQQRIAAEAIERTHRAAADPLIQNYEFCKAMKEAHASRQIINEHRRAAERSLFQWIHRRERSALPPRPYRSRGSENHSQRHAISQRPCVGSATLAVTLRWSEHTGDFSRASEALRALETCLPGSAERTLPGERREPRHGAARSERRGPVAASGLSQGQALGDGVCR